MPAATKFLSLASYLVRWFREDSGMSRAEYARMLASRRPRPADSHTTATS